MFYKKNFLPKIVILISIFSTIRCENSSEYTHRVKQPQCPGVEQLFSTTIENLRSQRWFALVDFAKGLDFSVKRKIIEVSVRFLGTIYDDLDQLSPALLSPGTDNEKSTEIPDIKTINSLANRCSLSGLLELAFIHLDNPDFIPPLVNIVLENKLKLAPIALGADDPPSEQDYFKLFRLMVSIFSNQALNSDSVMFFFSGINDPDYNKFAGWLALAVEEEQGHEEITRFFGCLDRFPEKNYLLELLAKLSVRLSAGATTPEQRPDSIYGLVKKTVAFLHENKEATNLFKQLLDLFSRYDNYDEAIFELNSFFGSGAWEEFKTAFWGNPCGN